jgi:hypothetical protein
MHVACRALGADHHWLKRRCCREGSGVGLSTLECGCRSSESGRHDCDRAAHERDCGTTAAAASGLNVVRTWGVRTLTANLRVSPSPCGCRLSGDEAGAGARSREHGPMRLRASSGLTQPT